MTGSLYTDEPEIAKMTANRSARAKLILPRRAVGMLVFGFAVVAAQVGCTSESSSAAPVQQASAPAAESDIPDVLATIDGQEITMTEIRARAGDDLGKMEAVYQRQRHKVVESTLDAILRERVLLAEAEKQGKTIDQLIVAEAGGSLDPSDVEVAAWYEENRARTGGRSLESIRDQVTDYLRNQRREEAAQKLQKRLNQERKVSVNLEPYRLRFNNEGAPALGPDNAQVTLVEFSDFECPFCNRFSPTLKRLEENYGDKLRIVYRQYPIPNLHANALKAAEASLCAHEQGKFWDLHDLMFQEQKRLAIRDLKEKAGRLGMDQAKFGSCLDSGRFAEQVQNDMREGELSGVTGTPALFVNGIPIDGGAVAYDVVARAIDKELERSTR